MSRRSRATPFDLPTLFLHYYQLFLFLLLKIYDALLPLLQVKFRDKPLSHYLLNTELADHLPQTRSEDHVDVQRCQAGAPLEPALTGLYFPSAEDYNPYTSCLRCLLLNEAASTDVSLFLCQ